jgi:hypothetical protein
MGFIVSRDYSPYGQASLISKLRAGIGAAILIVATAAVTATVVSKWYPFPPIDYEDCAARAAKDARSKDALGVLLSICSSEFSGRRKAGGGYTYYDECQDRTFDIDRPNPTPNEMKSMREQCRAHLKVEATIAHQEQQAAQETRRQQQSAQEARLQEQQAAQEARLSALQARKLAAMKAIRVTPAGFKCTVVCDVYVDMTVEVTNGSNEALSGVSIGLAFVPTNSACPASYAQREDLRIVLSPGETRTTKIITLDAAFSKLHVCIKVLDVQFAGN